MANDDIVAKYKTQIDSSASTAPAGTGDFDVWMGGAQPFTGAMANIPVSLRKPGPENTMKASALQESILALNGSRDPRYDSIVGLLVNSNFLKKDYAKYPTYASQALGTSLEVYNAYVKNGGDKPFPEWLDWYSSTSVPIDDGSGRGRYTGPVTTSSVSLTAKPDIERTLNTFAVDMLGRNLTDEELKKYTSEYSKQEMNAPQVVTTTPQGKAASSSVTQNTVSRETIAQNILQDNPTFADNVIKTDVLDMFFKRLGGAASGS